MALLVTVVLAALLLWCPVLSQSPENRGPENRAPENRTPDYGYSSSVPKELIPIVCLFFAGFIVTVCLISCVVFCLSDIYCPCSQEELDDGTGFTQNRGQESGDALPKLKLLEDGPKDDPPNTTGAAAGLKCKVSQAKKDTMMQDDTEHIIINMESYDSKLKGAARFFLQMEADRQPKATDMGLMWLGTHKLLSSSLPPHHLKGIQALESDRNFCSTIENTIRG